MAGQSPYPPPAASETVFVTENAGGPFEITRSNRIATFFAQTTRYVGAVDEMGFLQHADANVTASRLADKMLLRILARITPHNEGAELGPVKAYLHKGLVGRERRWKFGDILPSQWMSFSTNVNTADLVFPDDPCKEQSSSSLCGTTLQPAYNDISFEFSGRARLTMDVDFVSLEPAPDDLQGLACRPVLLLHGWNRDAEQMRPVWAAGLEGMDVPCYALDLAAQGTIVENAAHIAAAVLDLKNRFGVEKINIVGFSKGGIDAREYVRLNKDVEYLIMLGSPNGGSFGADLKRTGPLANAGQMTTEYMDRYNERTFPNPDVLYHTIAAYYDSRRATKLKRQYGPNDEVVSVASVETSIPDNKPSQFFNKLEVPTSTTDAESQGTCAEQNLTNHECLPNNQYIFTWGSIPVAQAPMTEVPNPPSQPLRQPCPEPDAADLAVDSGEDALQGVSSEAATVPSDGVTQSHAVLVDGVEEALFYAVADADLLSLELVSPSGTRIDPTTPSTDPAVDHDPMLDAELCWYTAYQIEQPETGTWTLEVTGTGAPSPDSQYSVATFAQLPPGLGVSMTVDLDRESYVIGEEIAVTATVTSDGSPVTDATVTAEIGLTDGTATTAITLPRRGLADDGTYSGALEAPSLPELYLVIVSAEGRTPAFTREQRLLVSVAPSATTFSGAFSDYGLDTDGDGRFDELGIDVGVEVDVAGEYRLIGTLLDGVRTAIEQVSSHQQLEPGQQTMSLRFDGARLFDLGLDGPYILDNLVIEDVATLTGLSRGPTYTTAAYSHDEFKRPLFLLTGNVTDRGVNTDPGNMLPYEELVIEIEVDTLVDADVQATAGLYAEDGTLITTGLTFVSLTAGVSMLAFTFLAREIYAGGKAGPYDLRFFSMGGMSTEDSLWAPGVVAVTQPYALEDFAESLTYSVGGTVAGLVGEGLELSDFREVLTVQPGDESFTFSEPRSTGSTYEVHIVAPPTNPIQVCSIVNATGIVGNSDVTDLAVECVTTAPEAGLDTSFGSGGKVVGPHDAVTAMGVQSDGKMVLVGGLTLTRYNTDGSPDSSFGSGGATGIVFGNSSYSAAQSVAIQPDDMIVVAGYTTSDTQGMHYDFALARYTAEGALDIDFGGGGTGAVTTDFGGYDKAFGVLVQPDGNIVAAGVTSSAGPFDPIEFGVARYTANGVLDPEFGSGGTVMSPIAGLNGEAAAVALQGDGKIVVAGPIYATGGENYRLGLVRYTANGAPDPDFRDAGMAIFDFGLPLLYPTDLALQDDGMIVVAGWAENGGSPSAFAAARFDAAGEPDANFGSGGLVTTPFGTEDARAQAVAIQSDGRILIAGNTQDFAVARYTIGGELDSDFGTDGTLTADFFANSDSAQCMAIQADGEILLGGAAWSGTMLALIRILA